MSTSHRIHIRIRQETNEEKTMPGVLEFPALVSDQAESLLGCAESVALAKSFIMSCVNALDSCKSSNFNARFENYVRHREECENCNIV
jgi:hypothetical protein